MSSKSESNTVDQSLDEALNQINKLKEDMNNLCEDLDSLYNTKANILNSSYNLNSVINEEEYTESLDSSDFQLSESVNIYNKCLCVYSSCTNTRPKCTTSFRNYLDDKLYDLEEFTDNEDNCETVTSSTTSICSNSTYTCKKRNFFKRYAASNYSLLTSGCTSKTNKEKIKNINKNSFKYCNFSQKFLNTSKKKQI